MSFAITYATDNGYAQHVAVSIYSLLEHSLDRGEIDIYILDNKLSNENRNKLLQTAGIFGKEVNFIDISDIESRLPENINTANLSISTYCRLFLPELMPEEVERVLYLDCDTLVCRDLRKITDGLAEDNWYVAGVEDTMYPEMKTGIGLARNDLYLNAGVLYINLKRWRKDNLTQTFLDFINSYKGRVPHLDQGVINGVFRHGKVRLPLEYNVQAPIFAIHGYDDLMKFFELKGFYTPDEVRAAKESPAIIHYTSFFVERPWFRFCIHPRKKDYRNTLNKTAFAGAELQNNRISFQQKLKDIFFKYFQPLYLRLR